MINLKKCPFCGGDAEIFSTRNYLKKHSKWMSGRKLSDEHKQHISDGHKRHWDKIRAERKTDDRE